MKENTKDAIIITIFFSGLVFVLAVLYWVAKGFSIPLW